MVHMVCIDHCLSWERCSKNNDTLLSCPKFTEQTMYVIRYLALQSLFGSTVYPYPGTWLDQPLWYIMAYGIARNTLNSLRKHK